MKPFSQRKAKIYTPREAMELAIEEGKKGTGYVSPNPQVGCVILDQHGYLLSTGYHKKYGGDHAEIEALKGLSEEQLENAHMFVTLEPCAHEGRTPPCAKKIADLKPASVTFGLIDPNPLVRGKGVDIIRQAGIAVNRFAELQIELEELAEIFLHNMKNRKPFIALKVASSLDGQMALKTGESKWITNEKSREYAHYLRGMYDAILIGRRTVLIDNPSLNVRHARFLGKANCVVVLDPLGELLDGLDARNFYIQHKPENIFIAVSQRMSRELSQNSVQLIRCPYSEDTGFDLEFMLRELYNLGVCSILLEGGAQVYQSFLKQNQIQRLFHFQAPVILGALNGLPWTQGVGISSMDNKIRLEHIRTLFFDDDILFTGRIPG